jgi:hypothetical protein
MRLRLEEIANPTKAERRPAISSENQKMNWEKNPFARPLHPAPVALNRRLRDPGPAFFAGLA